MLSPRLALQWPFRLQVFSEAALNSSARQQKSKLADMAFLVRSFEAVRAGHFLQRLRHRLFPKPKIFISYAREDVALAMFLFQELGKKGFDIYLDKEKTLAGEQFLAVIVSHLRRCDAVLALLSEHSVKSEWCQAELYYAHALRRTLVPVRMRPEGDPLALPQPMALLQRETQYLPLSDENGRAELVRRISQRFEVIRRRVRQRWIRNGVLILTAVGGLAWGLHSGVAMALRAWDRGDLLSRIERAQTVLRREMVEQVAQRFADDGTLRSKLLLMADDPERSTSARLNARIFAAALAAGKGRWALENLDWSHSRFENGELTEVTFRTGALHDVDFRNVSFSGVVWNEAPGFGISGSSFSGCRFNGGWFSRTNVIDTAFVNCTFYGTTLEISGFAAVRFKSRVANPQSEVIQAGEVTTFENATISNCIEPPAPDTLDFGGPANEVEFTDVVFESCRFRGFIRPSWFKKCHFQNCIFPPTPAFEELQKGGNSLTGCTRLNELCP
jgi:uncharacterized protein YjbI with pentapeptide repeats